jgi:hypothetical protein
VTFWINHDCACGTISVYVNGSYVGGIASYYTSGFPGCNASGCATATITGTGNTWHATATGHTWPAGGTGAITVPSGGCGGMQLL